MAQDVLAEAVQHHEAGRLKKAEKLYRGVLKANPKNSVALNLLGVLNYQAGRHSKAMSISPTTPSPISTSAMCTNIAVNSVKLKRRSAASWR
ncbi:MAG: tetratricopeptide repeat protein [Alphaproteobacteria bacterium]